MRSALWAAPCLLLLGEACIDDGDPDSYSYSLPSALTTGAYQQLRTTRLAAAPPPRVRAGVELSEFAVARFLSLELTLNVYSAESIQGQGLRAEWLGEPGGEPVRAHFGGALSGGRAPAYALVRTTPDVTDLLTLPALVIPWWLAKPAA